MKKTEFEERICEATRGSLDSLVGNDRYGAADQKILVHLESCPRCSAELESRRRLRAQLKTAIEGQDVPAGLQARIRERIRVRDSRDWALGGWPRLLAAILVIGAGVSLNYWRERLPALSDRPAQNAYIQKVSATLSSVLRVGLGDHIHCSIFRKYPQDAPTGEQMERDLGPSYKGLLSLVKSSIPVGYRVIMAHRCSYAGRKYIHLTFRKGDGLLSLVITRKNDGESLGGLTPAVRTSGIPVYQSEAQRYTIAGFDAGQYFAFVVSDLKGQANLQIAVNLAPSVHEFLANASAQMS